ncbi:MAG: protein kinase [Myxococcales bacterium]|nr:protein kinase [Myxococcales bacterium]
MRVTERRQAAVGWVGRTLGGRYLLHRVVGVGGHAAVFEAENTVTRARVAVKLLLVDAQAGRTVPERFLREAQTARGLSHPNIVAVLDAGVDPATGALYLVQEFLEGADLRARIGSGTRLTAAQCVSVILPVARALVVAHAAGIVHRDLKPGNIFLARDAQGRVTPKLIDFGISKRLDERDGEPLTQDGALLGTPDYMSPEQARGSTHLDGRSDVWALGVVMYELLAGRRPFIGPNYNVVIVAIAHETPPRLDSLVDGLPPALVELVHRALTRDLAGRFGSMHLMAEALARLDAAREALDTLPDGTERAVLAGGPDTIETALAPAHAAHSPPAPSVQLGATLPLTEPEAPSVLAEPPMVLPPPRRRLFGPAVATLGALAALGAGAWFAYRTIATPAIAQSPNETVRLGDGGARDAETSPRLRPTAPVAADLSEARALVRSEANHRVPERLSNSQLRMILPGWQSLVRACVGANWFGAVPVSLRVRGDGAVHEVSVGGSLARTSVAACVARNLAEERLPRFNAREQRIDWTWNLTPAAAAAPNEPP